ncbi:DNA-binding protein inhibitor ID-2 [Biomphalaria glabrata]|uniref:DNA-binding protein inhibitor ID-2-like n=1 Tax=Biomphalaria glabrata TaxID=6526 RepID=A0A2C9LGT3_BIOGL|nr:DNA-binding protein inhibitor ID-2-like [Biomphalaria glabrata]KAI8754460.1 DNA-binding protein inhibitor ID-2-like [Biomphalaria glabrata]KAI8774310.1 DNA-binding protein inhibitor ID-2 [Biomphalaria glabrata]
MKAVATERPRSGNILGVKKDSNCSIMKTASIEFRGEKFTLSDEMKECFLKLSDMVPDVPRNESGNIDGTVLMQYVIDYILDLELQLDGQGNFSTSAAFAASFPSKFVTESQVTREPLTEKSFDNIVSSHYEMTPSPCLRDDLMSPSDCDIRPPSK